ncbi:S8 family peptidase [Enhygromyxa salina]|uniref:Intracellular serine protease n=1 Tax=Enhygromyxa salina TaxID=215803 RepID=A0A2S9Y4F1_9BACT|nr:S8 family serine peptidase [Enhygromyxa salina]PRP99974.1 Intracellular serine protease [Enhygromyxa salina]
MSRNTSTTNSAPIDTVTVDRPQQFGAPQLGLALAEVDQLIRASEARNRFAVDGSAVTVAVCDTGLNTRHIDFRGKVRDQRNFTADNEGALEDANDGHGHGSNVSGIIVANGDHRGIAPGAGIVPLKVLSNMGRGSFAAVAEALEWVLDNAGRHNISVVCMSLGAGDNRTSDDGLVGDRINEQIQHLRERRIAVVIAAGNDYFKHGSAQGMSYPAILRHCVSVGAVYDKRAGSFSYESGAKAFSTGPDRITPFSQRLHHSVGGSCRTDLFAPGAPVTSAGIEGPRGESVQHGTSQAAPVVAGVIALMQTLHLELCGELPEVDELVGMLQRGATLIRDGDDESDNVTNTGLDFERVDAVGALDALTCRIQKRLFLGGAPLRGHARLTIPIDSGLHDQSNAAE